MLDRQGSEQASMAAWAVCSAVLLFLLLCCAFMELSLLIGLGLVLDARPVRQTCRGSRLPPSAAMARHMKRDN
jgi:hypothetical protein